MPRIQILELPYDSKTDQQPFAVIVDQVETAEAADRLREDFGDTNVAEALGARQVLVFQDTIDIPANEVPLDPDGYPVRVHVEGDFAQFRDQLEEQVRSAQARFTAAGSSL
ncbi:hypothetical protein OHA71_23790 [Streptomyces sp. NBC_00444]|uniref:hypothetical protein n=1 Tax=Streptomyces sp. NBC_00444 TaxID=2975744 RepID=UPI002E21BA6F